MDWDSFTIIYENHENLVYLQEVILNAVEDNDIKLKPTGKPVVTVKQLPHDTHDYRWVYLKVFYLLYFHIIYLNITEYDLKW